ncbi:MAG: hypothetical protein RL095_3717 [Verrucomicrobiota bacterium]|jgi:hypothetical protein
MSRAAAAQQAWLARAESEHARFLRACRDPQAAQNAVLHGQLFRAETSSFAREHALRPGMSPADFQKSVPIRSADELQPWIQRAWSGEKDVLTRDPLAAFEFTSGSTGPARLVPFSRSSFLEIRRAVLAWLADSSRRFPDAFRGSAYWSISPLARTPQISPSGHPVGFGDDAACLDPQARLLLQATLSVPSSLALCPELESALDASLLFLLLDPELSFLSVWNPSFLELLLSRCGREEIRHSLKTGAPPAGLHPLCAAQLAARLQRRCRAARVLELLHPPQIDFRRLWPRLALVSCWGDASAAADQQRLRRLLPGIAFESKGLMATEGLTSLPFGEGEGCPLALRSHFLEFRDEAGDCHLAHQLEPGRRYETILSTGAGLWRCASGDLVEVVGFTGRNPRIRFLGRLGGVCDLRGEKLSPAFVQQALDAVRQPDWAFALLCPAPGPAYTLLVEGTIPPDLAERLEAALRRNPHYAWCRDLGQLGPLEILPCRPGATERHRAELLRRHMRLGDIKASPLERDPAWRELLV